MLFLYFIIFSSATIRFNPSNSKMFSETLAQIRHLSLQSPDPMWADRAMHTLLCTNIKLTRRVLTKNVLKKLKQLGIGTNDVEKYAGIVCKQNVKQKRNVDLIKYTMKTKVDDAIFDEKMIRREFVRKSVVFGRTIRKHSQIDMEFKRIMRNEVETVWKDGKQKNTEKVAWASEKVFSSGRI